MMDKNATMTAMPDQMVTKVVKKKAPITTETRRAPDALLFAIKGDKGGSGGYGGKASKGGR
jgi:hypothetical protein